MDLISERVQNRLGTLSIKLENLNPSSESDMRFFNQIWMEEQSKVHKEYNDLQLRMH